MRAVTSEMLCAGVAIMREIGAELAVGEVLYAEAAQRVYEAMERAGGQRPGRTRVGDQPAHAEPPANAWDQWLSERCGVDQANMGMQATSSAMFRSWTNWATANGVNPGSNRMFRPTLEESGFTVKRTRDGVVVYGVRLKTIEDRRPASPPAV